MKMKRTRYFRRALFGVAIGAAILFGVSLVWQHISSRPCTLMTLQGVRYADRAALEEMIRDTMNARIVADRLRRHPWVRASSAVCYPTGMLYVWVEERVPRALIMSSDGRPTHLIDRTGYMMPADTAVAFDVPLIYNAPASYRPLEPVQDPGLRTLVEMLPVLDSPVDSLISEFIFAGDGLELITRPTPAGTATRVLLGHDWWDLRLGRLSVFWRQQIMQTPGRHFETVDLRFSGQIVTTEKNV